MEIFTILYSLFLLAIILPFVLLATKIDFD